MSWSFILSFQQNTIGQWQIVFWICFGIYMFGFLTYICLASGEEQDWARDDYVPIVTDITEDDIVSNINSVNPADDLVPDYSVST